MNLVLTLLDFLGRAAKLRLKVLTFIYRHLHGHDQQQFTVQSGILTGNDTRCQFVAVVETFFLFSTTLLEIVCSVFMMKT